MDAIFGIPIKVANSEKIKLKKIPDSSKIFLVSGFCICASERDGITPGATVACSIIYMPISCDELAL